MMRMPSARHAVTAILLGAALVFTARIALDDAEAEELQQVTQAAYGITANFGKWPDNALPWVYNPTGAPAGFTDEIVLDIFADSIREWTSYCNVNFEFLGVNGAIDIDRIDDFTPVWGWDDLGGSAGVAGPAFGGVNTQFGHVLYVDGTLELSNTVFSSLGSTPGEILDNELAVRATAAHEIGHFLGLGHSDRPDSIMFANPYNSVSHTLQDDIDACRTIYGYSNAYNPPPGYEPPAGGTNTYGQLFLSTSVDFPNAAMAVDDGMTYADSDGLFTAYYQPTPGYDDDLVTVIVDPFGRATRASNAEVVENASQIIADGLVTFRTIRETPGVWTFYAYDSTGLLLTETLTVTTSLPVVNDAPDATIEITENPATRAIAATATVTGDTEGDVATIIWNRPTIGQTIVPLGASSGADSRNVTLPADNLDWEVFVDVRDDDLRYEPTGTGPLGPPGQGFHNLHRYYASPYSMGPDLTGDNYGDILWRNFQTGENWVYGMAGNIKKTSEPLPGVSDPNWIPVGTGDYNADGKSDVLWLNAVSGQIRMWLMDGSSVVTSAPVSKVGTSWLVEASGDYDGDGASDILLYNASTGQLWMYLMNGPTITTSSLVANLGAGAPWIIAGSKDHNGDGRSDVLLRNSNTGQVWMYQMNGPAIASSVPVATIPLDWGLAGTGDFDGDGKADILWHNFTTGVVWMYLMDGATVTTSQFVSKVNFSEDGWQIFGTGDINGDSRADVFWRSRDQVSTGAVGSGINALYFMNGPTILRTAVINTVTDMDWVPLNNLN